MNRCYKSSDVDFFWVRTPSLRSTDNDSNHVSYKNFVIITSKTVGRSIYTSKGQKKAASRSKFSQEQNRTTEVCFAALRASTWRKRKTSRPVQLARVENDERYRQCVANPSVCAMRGHAPCSCALWHPLRPVRDELSLQLTSTCQPE